MGEFSPFHWLIVLAIVVLLFGGKKIPEVMKGLGEGIRSFKEGMHGAGQGTDADDSGSRLLDCYDDFGSSGNRREEVTPRAICLVHRGIFSV